MQKSIVDLIRYEGKNDADDQLLASMMAEHLNEACLGYTFDLEINGNSFVIYFGDDYEMSIYSDCVEISTETMRFTMSTSELYHNPARLLDALNEHESAYDDDESRAKEGKKIQVLLVNRDNLFPKSLNTLIKKEIWDATEIALATKLFCQFLNDHIKGYSFSQPWGYADTIAFGFASDFPQGKFEIKLVSPNEIIFAFFTHINGIIELPIYHSLGDLVADLGLIKSRIECLEYEFFRVKTLYGDDIDTDF